MMSRESGCNLLSEVESIQQSIQDILTTPIGSRVMRREYGSLLVELLDQPICDALILKCYSAIYTAISMWENRININQINIFSIQENGIFIDIETVSMTSGLPLNLKIPLSLGASK